MLVPEYAIMKRKLATDMFYPLSSNFRRALSAAMLLARATVVEMRSACISSSTVKRISKSSA
jgi:hypothetical protein